MPTERIRIDPARRKRRQGEQRPESRALTVYNAQKHGILATTPVMLADEDEREWAQHLAATVRDLAPHGFPAAVVLAERAAWILWRLKRCAAYGRAACAFQARRRNAIASVDAMLAKDDDLRAPPALDELGSLGLVPDSKAIDKVVRYESFLNRQLSRVLEQLEQAELIRQRAVEQHERIERARARGNGRSPPHPSPPPAPDSALPEGQTDVQTDRSAAEVLGGERVTATGGENAHPRP